MNLDVWLRALDAKTARRIRSVDHARSLALRRVPAPIRNYVEGGAGNERTLRANLDGVAAVGFRPRMGVTADVGPDLSTTVLGTPVSMPVLLSPVGFTRMMHPAGDLAGAAAAAGAGTISTLSTMSGHHMEDVMAAANGPVWFQLYFLGGRDGADQLVCRARDLGFTALVVTMDTQALGDRRREARYGLSPPLRPDVRTVTKMAPYVVTRPRWLLDRTLDGFRLDLVNALALGPQGQPMSSTEARLRWVGEPPRWEDIARLRDLFGGPVAVKGILTSDDARKAVDSGADAVIVSNHGGRQLDGVASSFAALPGVVAAVGDQAEVLVDGGIRSGADAVRAVALGARAAMVGRAWVYGLCAAGRPGVERILGLLREDVERSMRLLGVARVGDIDATSVEPPAVWPR